MQQEHQPRPEGIPGLGLHGLQASAPVSSPSQPQVVQQTQAWAAAALGDESRRPGRSQAPRNKQQKRKRRAKGPGPSAAPPAGGFAGTGPAAGPWQAWPAQVPYQPRAWRAGAPKGSKRRGLRQSGPRQATKTPKQPPRAPFNSNQYLLKHGGASLLHHSRLLGSHMNRLT